MEWHDKQAAIGGKVKKTAYQFIEQNFLESYRTLVKNSV